MNNERSFLLDRRAVRKRVREAQPGRATGQPRTGSLLPPAARSVLIRRGGSGRNDLFRERW